MDYSIYSMIPSNFVYKGINCDATIKIDVPNIENQFEFSAEDPTSEILGFTFSGQFSTYYPAIRDKHINGIIEQFNNKIENDDVNLSDKYNPKK